MSVNDEIQTKYLFLYAKFSQSIKRKKPSDFLKGITNQSQFLAILFFKKQRRNLVYNVFKLHCIYILVMRSHATTTSFICMTT